MKNTYYFILIFLGLLLTSCTTTFAGSLFILTFRDVLLYVFLAFIFAVLVALQSEDKRKAFFLWFLLSIVLTPLAGLIALLVKITK